MRRFEDSGSALGYVAVGGQALLVTGWTTVGNGDGYTRKDTSAHLFDQDRDRLQATAVTLGDTRHRLAPIEWRPGAGVWYVPLIADAVTSALSRCHSRIVRKTV